MKIQVGYCQTVSKNCQSRHFEFGCSWNELSTGVADGDEEI